MMSCLNFFLWSQPKFGLSGCSRLDSVSHVTWGAELNMGLQYIRVFMDVYLGDIIIYSKTLEEYVEHCKLIFDVLAHEVLYLSKYKMQIMTPELRVLGRIVDNEGIRMDPAKVDSILNWKVPTSKEWLLLFLGAVSYLADDISEICIPMRMLHVIVSSTAAWRSSET
jgi:hypothetical protein